MRRLFDLGIGKLCGLIGWRKFQCLSLVCYMLALRFLIPLVWKNRETTYFPSPMRDRRLNINKHKKETCCITKKKLISLDDSWQLLCWKAECKNSRSVGQPCLSSPSYMLLLTVVWKSCESVAAEMCLFRFLLKGTMQLFGGCSVTFK